MNQVPIKHRIGHPFDLPVRWRWLKWLVIAAGGGSVALWIWMKEESLAWAECAPVAVILGLVGLLYLFNLRCFRVNKPCQDDLHQPCSETERDSKRIEQ
jgi:hypothetical protein